MIDKLLELLKKADVEVNEELESQLKTFWEDNKPSIPEGDDVFTQEELDDIVQSRVARERKAYEGEIEQLQSKMKELVAPEKIEEYETKVNNLNSQLEEIRKNTARDYELKLLAEREGVSDSDYFEYLVEKNNLKDRVKAEISEDGKVQLFAVDKEGNALVEDGKKLGPETIIKELKESKPEIFTGTKKKPVGGSSGNPTGSSSKSTEELKEKSKSLAVEMGYKKQD